MNKVILMGRLTRDPNLKEFYAVYKGVEFKIYDASPMFTDDRKYQLKCRTGA